MELPNDFDFSQAQIDPWANLDLLEKFYIVTIRFTNGQCAFSLVKTATGYEDAIKFGIANIRLGDAQVIKDVSVILFDDMTKVDREDLTRLIAEVTGVNK